MGKASYDLQLRVFLSISPSLLNPSIPCEAQLYWLFLQCSNSLAFGMMNLAWTTPYHVSLGSQKVGLNAPHPCSTCTTMALFLRFESVRILHAYTSLASSLSLIKRINNSSDLRLGTRNTSGQGFPCRTGASLAGGLVSLQRKA